MLLVVLFHCEVYNPTNTPGCSHLFAFFRMPFFFFLSGYLFTKNRHEFSLKNKLKQIFRGLIWTYLIFTSISLIPKTIAYGNSLSDGIWLILTGKASWFVVALGGAQILFALLLRITKNVLHILIFMFLSLGAGYIVKLQHLTTLPFCFDSTLLVIFFFGLGFLYRIYEQQASRLIPISFKNLAGLTAFYFTAITVDAHFWGTPAYLFNTTSYHNFPLHILYAITGIGMMLLFVRTVPCPKILSFIGRNSLIFYYLNGGSTKIIYTISQKVGIHQNCIHLPLYGTIAVFLMSCVCLSITSVFIRRYCPILTGDKDAFNRLMQRLKLNINF